MASHLLFYVISIHDKYSDVPSTPLAFLVHFFSTLTLQGEVFDAENEKHNIMGEVLTSPFYF